MNSTDSKSQQPSEPGAEISAPTHSSALQNQNNVIAWLKDLLARTDPPCGHDDQDQILSIIHSETDGSEAGLALAVDWCRRGDEYSGPDEVARRWHLFDNDTESLKTVGAMDASPDADMDDSIDLSTRTETEPRQPVIINSDEQSPVTPPYPINPLDKFSLKGMRSQLEQNAVGQRHVLGELALMGQLTVFYASPGTGKSLITLFLQIDAISRGQVDPSKVYYFNFDDNLDGLLEKLDIADELGFHMLAEGCNDFSADKFLIILTEIIANNQANGIIIILDTLKKFVDLMNKRKSRGFGKLFRSLVMKGGTCIGLAHTNKHRDADGKPIHAGTSDIVEDFDCAYLMYEISVDVDTETKLILFENIKSRGNVARQASYRYSVAEGLSYRELIDSIEPVDGTELVTLKHAEEVRSDLDVIDAVTQCIREGIDTRMKLSEAVAERSGISKRGALRLIDKYSGSDPDRHRWNFQVHERGAKKYCLLAPDTTVTDHVDES